METIDETAIINQAPLPNQGIPEHESFTPSTDDCRRDTFKEIVKLAIGETKLVEKTEASLPRFTDFEVASKAFTLSVRFQDIEGNKYKQEIFMDRGICKPRPVAALTPDEADLPIKVVVQEAEPSINTYRQ